MSSALETGQSQLIQDLVTEIEDQGKITFARFMEQALYHESCGYYMTAHQDADGRGRASHIGWNGDYITTPYFQSFLAKALVRQLGEMDVQLGQPDELTLVEMGPGEGILARDVLRECEATAPDLADRLLYCLIERSPVMRALQEDRLLDQAGPRSRVCWVDSLDDMPDGAVTGLLFSNELVDAFPVHRVQIRQGQIKEVYVTWRDGRFVECVDDPSTPTLEAFLQPWAADLPDGYTTEVNVQAVEWMKNVARVLQKGFVVTIDYGHTHRDYFSPARWDGTLVGYYRHQFETDVLTRVGLQDVTAHVNFSSLAETGEASGLACVGFTDLQHFLMSLGMEEMLAGCDQEGPAVQAAIQLLNPRGMGRTFKILVQQKDLPDPVTLSGLRHRPFFDDALGKGAPLGFQRH